MIIIREDNEGISVYPAYTWTMGQEVINTTEMFHSTTGRKTDCVGWSVLGVRSNAGYKVPTFLSCFLASIPRPWLAADEMRQDLSGTISAGIRN